MKLFQPKEWKLLWPFYVTQFLFGCIMLTYPFFVIYYQTRGLTLAQMAFMWSLMSVAKVICEIPTGVVADVFGRKTSVIIGYLGVSFCWLLVPFTPTYPLLMLLLIITAVFQTFISGALDAWVYDLLKHEHCEPLYKRAQANWRIIFLAGAILGQLIGAWLVTFTTIDTLFILEGGFGILFSCIILFAREHFTRKKARMHEHARDLVTTSKEGLAYVANHTQLKLLFIIGALFAAVTSVVEELGSQPLLVGLGMPVAMLGVFMATFMAVIALSQFLGLWLEKYLPEKAIYLTTTAIKFIAVGAIYFLSGQSYLLASALLLVGAAAERAQVPIFITRMNRFIPSKTRATILSTSSVVNNAAYIGAILLGGFLIDRYGAQTTVAAFSLFLIPAFVAFCFLRNTDKPTRIR